MGIIVNGVAVTGDDRSSARESPVNVIASTFQIVQIVQIVQIIEGDRCIAECKLVFCRDSLLKIDRSMSSRFVDKA